MFAKWDIIYASNFPETVKCCSQGCHGNFSIEKYNCPHCGQVNTLNGLIPKPRPIILWIDQARWFQSVGFGIPLSTTRPAISDKFNQSILIPHYVFLHKDNKYNRPMRAVISQATRLAGNTLRKREVIGKITDTVTIEQIEGKLIDWLF